MSDDWIRTLRGADDSGPEDARIIRAIVKAQTAAAEDEISDEQMNAAKQALLGRLQDVAADGDGGVAEADNAKVVAMTRRGRKRLSGWNMHTTGILLAASVAIIAVGILTFGALITSEDLSDPIIIASYAEIDTVRGLDDMENRIVVEDPGAYGLILAGMLTARKIPFVLLRENQEATDRIIKVQLDGHANTDDAIQLLEELGVVNAADSVVVVRLTAEE